MDDKTKRLVDLSWIIPVVVWIVFVMVVAGVVLYWFFTCKFLDPLDRCLKKCFGWIELKVTGRSKILRMTDEPLTHEDFSPPSSEDEDVFTRVSFQSDSKPSNGSVAVSIPRVPGGARRDTNGALPEQDWHKSQEVESKTQLYYEEAIARTSGDVIKATATLEAIRGIFEQRFEERRKEGRLPTWLTSLQVAGALPEGVSSRMPYAATLLVEIDLRGVTHSVSPSENYQGFAVVRINTSTELLNFTKYRNMLCPVLMRSKIVSVLEQQLLDQFSRTDVYFSEHSGKSGYVNVFLRKTEEDAFYGIDIKDDGNDITMTIYQLYPVNVVMEDQTYYFTDEEYLKIHIYPAISVQPLHTDPIPDVDQFPNGSPEFLIARSFLGTPTGRDDTRSELLWQMSFVTAERDKLQEFGAEPYRQLLALVLSMRHKHTQMLVLSEYHIKTSLLHFMQYDRSGGNFLDKTLASLFVQYIAFLYRQLFSGKLPHFFVPGDNLIDSLYRDQLYPVLSFLKTAHQSKRTLIKMLKPPTRLYS